MVILTILPSVALLNTFDNIYTIDLHGNSKKKEVCPDGSKDENVFDIMQGVSINIFVKTGEKANDELGKLYHKDIFGRREDKYEFLNNNSIDTVDYKELTPQAPMYFFVPKDSSLEKDYNKGVAVNTLFTMNNVGVVTSNDAILVNSDNYELCQKVSSYYNEPVDKSLVSSFAYKVFDNEYLYYDKTKIERPREQIMKHLTRTDNIALVVSRQCVSDWRYVFISDKIVNFNFIATAGRLGAGYVFPLYLYTTAIDGTEEKVPNLNHEEWQKFNDAVGRDTTPEELLHYIYGVLHSPTYRERYKEFLKIDFPRIPLPQSEEEFNRLAGYGRQLIDLHLMRNANTWQIQAQYNVSGSNTVELLRYVDGNVWINSEQYFGNVPEEAWNAYIGGYQPAQKWLKDRKGRTLAFDDIRHYLRIIHALSETQRIMKEIG